MRAHLCLCKGKLAIAWATASQPTGLSYRCKDVRNVDMLTQHFRDGWAR